MKFLCCGLVLRHVRVEVEVKSVQEAADKAYAMFQDQDEAVKVMYGEDETDEEIGVIALDKDGDTIWDEEQIIQVRK